MRLPTTPALVHRIPIMKQPPPKAIATIRIAMIPALRIQIPNQLVLTLPVTTAPLDLTPVPGVVLLVQTPAPDPDQITLNLALIQILDLDLILTLILTLIPALIPTAIKTKRHHSH